MARRAGCGVAPQGRYRSTDSPKGVGQCNLVPHPTSVSKADSEIMVQLPLAIVYFNSLRGAPLPGEKPFGRKNNESDEESKTFGECPHAS